MAISFVAAGAVATGTNPTVAVPAGYQEGDLLVLTVAVGAAVAPTTPSGWTLVGSQTTTPRIYIYRKFAAGTESSLALTVNSTTTAAVMVAYRGVSATDTISTFATATATTVATNTLTTTYANEYVVSVYAMTTGADTWTAPGSTTSRVNSAGTAALAGVLIVDELQAAAGTSTARTATSSVSKALAAGSFSIIPSGRYWVGGAGTWNTTSTTNWSFSSGGASGAPVPTAQDNVAFDQAGTYTVTLSGALNCLDFTVSAGTVTFSSTGTPNIRGSMTLLAGTVWSATGTITFSSTSTGRTITTNGVTVSGVITFNGSGGVWTLGSALTTTAAINVTAGTFSTSASNYAITTSGLLTVNGGTLTLNGSTLSLSRSGAAFTYTSGTFNANTSQINITNGTLGTLNGGGVTFYNVSYTGVGTVFLNGANTFNNLTLAANTATSRAALVVSADQTINGTLTLNPGSNVTCRYFITSNTVGTVRTFTCAAIAAGTADYDFADITIAGAAAPLTGTRLGNCRNNSGITFPVAKTVYWNLAGSQNWSSTGWATTSTGTPAINNFPLPQDTAVFTDAGAAGTVNIDAPWNMGTIDMSGRTSAMTLSVGQPSGFSLFGSWLFGTGVTFSNPTNYILYVYSPSGSITSNGVSWGGSRFQITTPSGTITLQDAFTTTGGITFSGGTIDLNGKTFTVGTFLANAAADLTFNGGNLSVTGSGSSAFSVTSTLTTTAGTGTGTISMTSASAKTFAGNGRTYNCTLDQGGAGALTITGSNTFSNITNTYGTTGATSILFTASTTSTFTNWSANGTAGKLLTIGSVTAASHTLSKASGIVSANYLSISRSTATGGATWYAGTTSTDGGNNSGWIFTAPPSTGNFLMFFM